MKIGMMSVDSKIAHLCLMKLAQDHIDHGDTVFMYDPMYTETPDLIYAAKVFSFTPDFPYFPDGIPVVRGGPGYDVASKLPDRVEAKCPYYALYPFPILAMGHFTRGCPRKCPWCVVWQIEGLKCREVADLDHFWRGQDQVMIMDANLTANATAFERALKQLITAKVQVNFSQGLDIRFIDADKAALLKRVRLGKNRIHFAFDDIKSEESVRRGMAHLKAAGIHPDKAEFYVLIGFNTTPEEDMHRIEVIRSLGSTPFVMPFDKSDPYQQKLAGWANNKARFKKIPWEKYQFKQRDRVQEVPEGIYGHSLFDERG